MKSMDNLKEIEPMMDWESLSLMVKKPHRNDMDMGGRSTVDEIVIIKTLLLQSVYNLSDESVECFPRLDIIPQLSSIS